MKTAACDEIVKSCDSHHKTINQNKLTPNRETPENQIPTGPVIISRARRKAGQNVLPERVRPASRKTCGLTPPLGTGHGAVTGFSLPAGLVAETVLASAVLMRLIAARYARAAASITSVLRPRPRTE